MGSIEELKDLYQSHLEIPFPKDSENDELSDCIEQLSLIDSYVVGLVVKTIDQGNIEERINDISLVELKNKLKQLTGLGSDDFAILESVEIYLHSLERLIESLETHQSQS